MVSTNNHSKQDLEARPVKLFIFNLPKGFEVAVPENEVLKERPVGPDEKQFLAVNISKENGPVWVRTGRLFHPRYYEEIQKSLNEQTMNKVSERSKAIKEMKKLKESHENEIHLYKAAKEAAQGRAEEAEKEKEKYLKLYQAEVVKQRKELDRWQAAYEALRLRHLRLENELESEHHLRVLIQQKADDESKQMEAKIMDIQSDLEETRITEAELVNDYKQLCSKITGCIQCLKFHLPDLKRQDMEKLRCLFDFEIAETLELSLLDNAISCELFVKVWEKAKAHVILGLAQWSTAQSQIKENPNFKAFIAVEKDMHQNVLELGRMMNCRDSGGKRQELTPGQRAESVKREELLKTLQSYFQWRADTIRLHDQLDSKYPGVRRETSEIVNEVADHIGLRFFQKIMQKAEGEIFSPAELFLQDDVDKREATKIFQSFGHKLRGCVEQAMQLFLRMRMGRAQYILEWKEGCLFNPEEMKIKSDQEALLIDEEISRLFKSNRLEAAYCIFPALVKFGDDYGKGYHQKKILIPAETIVRVLDEPLVDSKALHSADKGGTIHAENKIRKRFF